MKNSKDAIFSCSFLHTISQLYYTFSENFFFSVDSTSRSMGRGVVFNLFDIAVVQRLKLVRDIRLEGLCSTEITYLVGEGSRQNLDTVPDVFITAFFFWL